MATIVARPSQLYGGSREFHCKTENERSETADGTVGIKVLKQSNNS